MGKSTRKPTYDELLDLIAELRTRIVEQDKRIAELERRLGIKSRNSSKPPAADGLDLPTKTKRKRR